MRLASLDGRAAIVSDLGAIDVNTASGGAVTADLDELVWGYSELRPQLDQLLDAGWQPYEIAHLTQPLLRPPQVFAIGLNYRAHAEESGMAIPSMPATFTKFPASISGPFDPIPLSGPTVDWEAELVVVIGRRCAHVPASDAWAHVAGLTIGQDISDRTTQFAAGSQFSLGKSYRGYGPIGPWITTVDELAAPDDLAIGCRVNGVDKQVARTSDMVFGVSELVAQLSAIVDLLPGDLIFTGTPAGIGATRQPAEFLGVGDVVETWIEGLGSIRNQVVASS
jgi:2,4-didehydro-3-deoxy-L-rhamnonate hydrolase